MAEAYIIDAVRTPMGRKKGGGPAKPRGEAMPTREVPPCLSSALFVAGLIGLAAASPRLRQMLARLFPSS